MTSSSLRPRPLQRANSESTRPAEPIEVLCQRYGNQILDLIPQQLLDKAKDITLADMLGSEITTCETISWLINVIKFTKFYTLNDTPDNVEFYQELLDIKNLLGTSAYVIVLNFQMRCVLNLNQQNNNLIEQTFFKTCMAPVKRQQVPPQKPFAEELTLLKSKGSNNVLHKKMP